MPPSLFFDEERRRIDAELQQIEKYARTQRIYRNTLAPISKLPPEVLGHIFLLYQNSIQGPDTDLYDATNIDYPKPPRDYRVPLEWIKLTHVSTEWRTTAENLKALWTHFSFRNLLLAKDMLMSRSQGHGLVFRDSIGYESIAACGIFFYHNLHRVREIDVAGYDILSRILNPQIIPETTRASRLHRLRLACSVSGSFALPDVDVLAALLSRTKMLRVLEIDFPLKWDTAALSGLTQLKVEHGDHIRKPAAAELFGALTSMPQLQLLHLVADALPLRAGDPPTVFTNLDRQRVYLPSLRTLILNSSVDSIHFFLENINVPQTAQIRLRSSRCPEQNNIPYVSMIVSRLRQMFWPFRSLLLPGPPIHSMELSFSNREFFSHDALQRLRAHVLRLQVYDATPITDTRAPFANGPIYITNSFIDLELPWIPHNNPVTGICQDAPALLSDICHTLPCKYLTVLTLRVRDDSNISTIFTVGDTYFLDVFGEQPYLRTLYTNPPVLQSLLRNLSPPADPRHVRMKRMVPESPPTILFPELFLLHVSNNFRSCISDQAFYSGLSQRTDYHRTLDTLSIPSSSNPNGPYSSVALLRQQVNNLIQRPR